MEPTNQQDDDLLVGSGDEAEQKDLSAVMHNARKENDMIICRDIKEI